MRRLESHRPSAMSVFPRVDFKAINDSDGHAEGDRALVSFAEVLRDALRDSDVIGRLGGDEFVALLTDSDIAKTAAVTQRLQEQLAAHNAAAQRGYAIRFSVGQIEYDPQYHASIADLLAAADAAMYVNSGRRRHRQGSAPDVLTRLYAHRNAPHRTPGPLCPRVAFAA
jgi:diguanylate cyclase (GGDEF)-like protein